MSNAGNPFLSNGGFNGPGVGTTHAQQIVYDSDGVGHVQPFSINGNMSYDQLVQMGADPQLARVISGGSSQGANYGTGGSFGGDTNPYLSNVDQGEQAYSKVIDTYMKMHQDQNTNQQGILAAYGNLYPQIHQDIQGIDASQRQAITDQYAKAAGATTQNAVSRGLANSTVVDSMQRGNLYDKQKADIALTNQTQALDAGYLAQSELARLAFASQANQNNMSVLGNLAQFQGNFLNARMGQQTQAAIANSNNANANARSNAQIQAQMAAQQASQQFQGQQNAYNRYAQFLHDSTISGNQSSNGASYGAGYGGGYGAGYGGY